MKIGAAAGSILRNGPQARKVVCWENLFSRFEETERIQFKHRLEGFSNAEGLVQKQEALTDVPVFVK